MHRPSAADVNKRAPRSVDSQLRSPTPQESRALVHLRLVAAALLVATIAVYAPVAHFDYVDLDDDVYVTANRRVQAGLTWDGIVWAFTTGHAGFWHPFTWLSHMLDCQLFGLDAGGHHLTNLVLHAANTLLLLGALHTLTGAVWRSAFVAAVFALHPLHVESVAWVAERKDVLSTAAWLAALWAYASYARRPGRRRLVLVEVAFSIGLLAKAMIVTLPFVLLLLDWWPLDRARTTRPGALVAEKVPLFVLAAVGSVVAFVAAARWGAVVSLTHEPIRRRLATVLVAYVRYLGKAVWPTHLAIFYPMPVAWPAANVVAAALLLFAITACALVVGRRYPYVLVGWLWFVGTLVPVIGVIQAGNQAMADRFTYVALIGPTIVAVWGVEELLRRSPAVARAAAWGGLFVVAVLGVASRKQLGYWRDSTALFTHALAVTTDNWLAHNNLGYVLLRQGRTEEATAHFRAALAIKPGYMDAVNNLGDVLIRSDRAEDAIAHFSAALALHPDDPVTHYNLGNALAKRGDVDAAAREFAAAVRLRPDYPAAHYNLGVAFAARGNSDEAMAEFTRALENDPHQPDAHNALGNLLLQRGRVGDAVAHLSEAVRFDRSDATKHYNLGVALVAEERTDEAIAEFAEAVRLKPDLAEAHGNLAVLYAKQGRTAEAAAEYASAVRLKPDLTARLRRPGAP